MAVNEALRCLNCNICSLCKQCEVACEANAINHDMEEELLEVAAVVMYEAGKCSLRALTLLDAGMKTAKKDGVTLYDPNK